MATPLVTEPALNYAWMVQDPGTGRCREAR